MFWMVVQAKFLTRILAIWCITLLMLGSVVAAEQPRELEHGLTASTTIVPAVEISDTAVQLLAQRLTQANSKFKSLASLSLQQTGTGSKVSCYDHLITQRSYPERYSLLLLGTELRL